MPSHAEATTLDRMKNTEISQVSTASTRVFQDDVVVATGLTKSFGSRAKGNDTPVLRGVDIEVPRGALVSIVGPSGCGKSTLLYCLSGLDRPDGGALHGFGTDMLAISTTRLARLYRTKIGFIFQSMNLVGSLSAWDNTVLPTRLRRGKIDAGAVTGILAKLDMADHVHTRAARLSNGQQQRVALARVLSQQPDVIFADEPTGALDSNAGAVVLDILRDYPRGGRSVIMVTHDIAAACRSDIVYVMRDGVIHNRFTAATPDLVLAAMEGTR